MTINSLQPERDYSIYEATLGRNTAIIPINTGSNLKAETHITGSYDLYELSITIKNGSKISLIETFKTVELYEDIFSHSISGHITIVDAVGGLEKFMISGGETITLIALKPFSSDILVDRQDLIVTEVSKVRMDDLNSMSYRLSFLPKSAIESEKKRIYNAFDKRKKITGIMYELYTAVGDINKFSINLTNEDAKVPLEKTFLCPGYSSFQAIDFLAKRASYSGDYCLFFERVNTLSSKFTHVFAGINKLISISGINTNSMQEISYQPSSSAYVTRAGDKTIRAKTLEIQNGLNHMNNMLNGYYHSRIRTLDLITRRFEDTKFKYEDIKDINSENLSIDRNNIFLKYDESAPDVPGERLLVRPSNDVLGNKSQWVRNTVYGSVTLSSMRVIVDIEGGSNMLGVGNYIKLNLPSMQAKALSIEESQIANDTIYSGNYFITAVKHSFTITGYQKKLELSKSVGSVNIDNLLSNFSDTPPPNNVEHGASGKITITKLVPGTFVARPATATAPPVVAAPAASPAPTGTAADSYEAPPGGGY